MHFLSVELILWKSKEAQDREIGREVREDTSRLFARGVVSGGSSRLFRGLVDDYSFYLGVNFGHGVI